jgi:hypothetical protein
MFAKTTNVGFAQRVVATLVASAVVLWSLGAYISTAQAAALSEVSDTLSTSNPGVTASHTIVFKLASNIASGDTITITFPTGAGEFIAADFAGIADTDVTADVDGNAIDTSVNFSSAAGVIQFDNDQVDVAGATVTVAIADGLITNPTNIASHEIEIQVSGALPYTDIGKTRIAIVDSVLVTAVVETTFDFVIEGLATGTPMANGITETPTGSSTPTALDYGVLVGNTPEALAQRLNVTTNAKEGFVVTVQTDGEFESANGAIIDSFNDAADLSDTGTVWAQPGGGAPDIDTPTEWGHWGLISDDGDLVSAGGAAYSEEFQTSESFIAASTSPRVVFHHTGAADGSTQDKGEAIVLYKVEITDFQEAADDYTTTLTYIATPTF